MASSCAVSSILHFFSETSTAAAGVAYSNGTTTRIECPTGQFARAISVRSGAWPGSPKGTSILVQGVNLFCTSEIGTSADIQGAGVYGQYRGIFDCNPGQLLDGAQVWAGSHIDGLIPRCRDVAPSSASVEKKVGTKLGGGGGAPVNMYCSESPGRFVYGMILYHDGSTSGIAYKYRVVNSIKFLCR